MSPRKTLTFNHLAKKMTPLPHERTNIPYPSKIIYSPKGNINIAWSQKVINNLLQRKHKHPIDTETMITTLPGNSYIPQVQTLKRGNTLWSCFTVKQFSIVFWCPTCKRQDKLCFQLGLSLPGHLITHDQNTWPRKRKCTFSDIFLNSRSNHNHLSVSIRVCTRSMINYHWYFVQTKRKCQFWVKWSWDLVQMQELISSRPRNVTWMIRRSDKCTERQPRRISMLWPSFITWMFNC